MRYLLIEKSNGKQAVFANAEEAYTYVDFCLGESCLLRSLIFCCTVNFTFEDENFILKGYKDD